MKFRLPFVGAVVAALALAGSANALTTPYTFDFSGGSPLANTSTWQGTTTRDFPPFGGSGSGGGAARVARSTGTAYTFGTAANAFNPFGASNACASAWVYPASASAVGKPVRIFIRERTSAGVLVGSTASATVNLPNGWVRIDVQRSFVGTSNKIDAYVEQKSAVAGDVIYVDDLTVDGAAGAPIPPGGC